MKLYKLSLNETKTFLSTLKCDKSGVAIMSKKAKVHTLFIKDLHVGAANILKQDALSIGADLAVPEGVIIAKDKFVNALLIGTTKHFEILSRKELSQHFELKGEIMAGHNIRTDRFEIAIDATDAISKAAVAKGSEVTLETKVDTEKAEE